MLNVYFTYNSDVKVKSKNFISEDRDKLSPFQKIIKTV